MATFADSIVNLPPEVLATLTEVPALIPPRGEVSNFENPPSRERIQFAVTSTALAFAILFFLNRVYAKLMLMKKVTWDDGTITIAMLLGTTYYVSATWACQYSGMGAHQWNVSVAEVASADMLVPVYLIAVLTPSVFLFLKTSFFILYLQLFQQLTWVRICSWIGIVVTTSGYTAFIAYTVYFAIPRNGQSWFANSASPGMRKVSKMSVPQSIIGLAIDLYILFIPVLALSRLTLSFKRKLGSSMIFLSGTSACVLSAVSIHYRIKVSSTEDITWALLPVNISTLGEIFIGIVCACIPSAVYAARQRSSIYRRFLKLASDYTDGFKTKLSVSTKSSKSAISSRTTGNHPDLDVMKSTDRKYAQYFSLNDMGPTTITTTTTKISGNDGTVVGTDSDDTMRIMSTRTFDVERQ